MRAEQAVTGWNFGHFWQTCCFTKITPKAILHNYIYICGALRKFCALILLRFCNTPSIAKKRAASVRKIYSQISLDELCGIALTFQSLYGIMTQ